MKSREIIERTAFGVSFFTALYSCYFGLIYSLSLDVECMNSSTHLCNLVGGLPPFFLPSILSIALVASFIGLIYLSKKVNARWEIFRGEDALEHVDALCTAAHFEPDVAAAIVQLCQDYIEGGLVSNTKTAEETAGGCVFAVCERLGVPLPTTDEMMVGDVAGLGKKEVKRVVKQFAALEKRKAERRIRGEAAGSFVKLG